MGRIVILIAGLLFAAIAQAGLQESLKPKQVWTCLDHEGNKTFQDHACNWDQQTLAEPEKSTVRQPKASPLDLLAFVPDPWKAFVRKYWPSMLGAVVVLFALRWLLGLLTRGARNAKDNYVEKKTAREKRQIDKIPWKPS